MSMLTKNGKLPPSQTEPASLENIVRSLLGAIGLSKIPRIVDLYARRLQIQERLTRQVAAELEGILNPLGVGVVIHGQHLCSMMRGVKKPGAGMVTSAMRGCLKTDWRLRQEFLEHLKRS